MVALLRTTLSMTGRKWCRPARFSEGDIVMKIIVSALILLSVLAGIAGPSVAADARTFYEQLDRQAGG
jgi:hypothetical protein